MRRNKLVPSAISGIPIVPLACALTLASKAGATGTFEQVSQHYSSTDPGSHPDIATTIAGSANPANIRKWAQWMQEPLDGQLLREVQAIFEPVKNIGHVEGLPKNN